MLSGPGQGRLPIARQFTGTTSNSQYRRIKQIDNSSQPKAKGYPCLFDDPQDGRIACGGLQRECIRLNTTEFGNGSASGQLVKPPHLHTMLNR